MNVFLGFLAGWLSAALFIFSVGGTVISKQSAVTCMNGNDDVRQSSCDRLAIELGISHTSPLVTMGDNNTGTKITITTH